MTDEQFKLLLEELRNITKALNGIYYELEK